MKTKIKAFLHYHKYEWQAEPQYQINGCDMKGSGPNYVLIREQEFEVDIPDDFDPRPIQIETLRAEKTKIIAECEAKKTNIDEQIQRLLAIEHKPEPEPVA